MRSESWQALALAAVIFGASFARDPRWRARIASLGLLLLLIAMLRLPLHLPFAEGDYSDFVQDRSHFANYMGLDGIQFQYHLSSQIVRGIDALYGQTTASMGEAFHWLSRIIATVLVLGLAVLGYVERWSVRVTRYIALAVAVPTIDLFFGYHEFGILPAAIEIWAIPFVCIALERRAWGMYAAAVGALGIGCALHGFGLAALAFALFAGVLRSRTARDLGRVAVAGVVGLAGWTGWVALYEIELNDSVAAGHADELPLRPLLHAKPYPIYHRVASPVVHSLHTIGWEMLVVAAPAVLLLLWARSELRWILAVAAVPSLLGVVFFWPVQGLAGDTDYLASAFPLVFAVGWLAADRLRLAAAMLGLMVVGHVALAHVLTIGYFHG